MIIRRAQPTGLQNTFADGRLAPDDAYIVNQVFGTSPLGNVLCSLGSNYTVEVFPDGTGHSWFAGSELTRRDGLGKAWYIQDQETGDLWSAFFGPVGEKSNEYEVKFSPGQASVYSLKNKIASTLTISTVPDCDVELWHVNIENRSARPRKLAFTTYFETGPGVPLESKYLDLDKVLVMRAPLGAVEQSLSPSPTSSMVLFHSSTLTPACCQTDKSSFTPGGSEVLEDSDARMAQMTGETIASFTIEIELPIEGEADFGFCFGVASSAEQAIEITRRFKRGTEVSDAIQASHDRWNELCAGVRVETSDRAFDALVNTWLPYETYAAWSAERGREAYADPKRIADRLRWLYPFCGTAPEECRRSLLEFASGLSMTGAYSDGSLSLVKMSPQELLWLAFVAANYVAETGDAEILSVAPETNGGVPLTLGEHCERAIRMCLNSGSEESRPGDDWLLEQTVRLWQFVSEGSSTLGLPKARTQDPSERSDEKNLPRRARYLQSLSPALSGAKQRQQLIDALGGDETAGWNAGTPPVLYSVLVDRMLGIRATAQGLLLQPNLPAAWFECTITRLFRGDSYEIAIRRSALMSSGNPKVSIVVDGEPLLGSMLPYSGNNARHRVDVILGE